MSDQEEYPTVAETFSKLRHWKKCCEVCAFRKDVNPDYPGKSRFEIFELMDPSTLSPFSCIHQTNEAGAQQVCAGWWAVNSRKRVY